MWEDPAEIITESWICKLTSVHPPLIQYTEHLENTM